MFNIFLKYSLRLKKTKLSIFLVKMLSQIFYFLLLLDKKDNFIDEKQHLGNKIVVFVKQYTIFSPFYNMKMS